MKRTFLTISCIAALALSARAEPPSVATPVAEPADAQSIVTRELVAPWRARQRSFSRTRRPPAEMRVRILDTAARHDAQGQAFFWFEVDSRRAGKAWRAGMMKGCVYPSSSTVYVQEGDALREVKTMLDDEERPVPATACKESAP